MRVYVFLSLAVSAFAPTLSALQIQALPGPNVAVTPDGGSTTVTANSSGNTVTFLVRNVGTTDAFYALTCIVSGGVTGCSASPSSASVLSGGRVFVQVTFSVGDEASGTLTLNAFDDEGPASDQGYFDVTINEPQVPGVSVTPDGSTPLDAPYATDDNPATFTVTNTGGTSDTYTLSCTWGGAVIGCTPNQGSVTVTGGTSAPVGVTYETSGSTGGSGTVTLTASGDATDTGFQNVLVHHVLVQALDPSVTIDAGTSATVQFGISNIGTVEETYTLSCTWTGAVTGCSGGSSVTVGPSGSVTVNRTVTASAAGGSGTVTLTASGNATDDQSADIFSAIHAVAVTPDGGSLTVAAGGGGTATFVVRNNGNISDTYTLDCGRTGAVSSCTDPAAVTIPPGDSSTVGASFTTLAAGGNGTVTLTASGPVTDTGNYSVFAEVVAVAVTPDGGALSVQAGVPNQQATFTVANSGNTSDTYTLTCTPAGAVTSCPDPTPGSVTVGPSDSTEVTVTFSTSAGGGTGTVTLTAAGDGTDSGTYNVTAGVAEVVVTPDGGSLSAPEESAGNMASFLIANTGDIADTYSFSCPVTGDLVTCLPPAGMVTVAANDDTTVTASFTTGSAGSGTVTLIVDGAADDEGSYNVTVTAAGGGGTIAVTPVTGTLEADAADEAAVTTFEVRNEGSAAETVSLACSVSGEVTDCAAPGSVQLSVGEVETVTVDFETSLPGSGTLSLTASGSGGDVTGSYAVSVNLPEQPPQQSAWLADDSLPIPEGEGINPLLGPVPLPPANLRGCPIEPSAPDINLVWPYGWLQQFGPANPDGMIFTAGVMYGDTLGIQTITIDRADTDPTTCSDYVFLDEEDFDYDYWQNTYPDDPLWDGYPYGDRGQGGAQAVGPIVSPLEGPSPAASGGDPALGGIVPPLQPGGGDVTANAPNPGAIDAQSYSVSLNGTLIIQNSQPVGAYAAYVTVPSLEQVGANFDVASSIPIMNLFDLDNPTANDGGWNELIVTVSDSSDNTSSVRARFVQVGAGQVAPIAVTPLRDAEHLRQGDCAAFGAFQCHGVMLTQPIPGFVTRDRVRGLNLVYRSSSQRAPTILPYEIAVNRLQLAPESLHVSMQEAGVDVSDTLRYFGSYQAPGLEATEAPLWEAANEVRVLGGALPAPASADAAIRDVTARIRSFYGAQGMQDDIVSQEVVQLYLTDTTSTRFGAGWTLAELSRLVLGQTSGGIPAAIWLRGDGSYVIFRNIGGTWQSPSGEPTTLIQGGGGTYFIYRPDGTRLRFRSDGWIDRVFDLLGNQTQFAYQTVGTGRLTQITDPTGHAYLFQYNANIAGRVGDIVVQAPGGETQRVATLQYDTEGRLTKVLVWRSDTLADSVLYGYATTSNGAYVTSVTDPRSTPSQPILTTFEYDQAFWLPAAQVLPTFRTGVDPRASFRHAWRRAVPRVGRGTGANLAERLVFTNQLRGTFSDVNGDATDYTIDAFGGPTWVRRVAPEPLFTPDFLTITFGGDDVRRIERDSIGRAVKIVRAPDSTAIADSVMYRYDVFNRVDRIVRTTLAYPATTFELDTIAFAYDSISLGSGRYCHRLLTVQDAMGGITRTLYGASGIGRCLPAQIIGLANDTTIFTYGSLTSDTPSATRPASIRDPNGLSSAVTYDGSTWNTVIHERTGDGATSTAHYDAFGRIDSIIDPVGTRTVFDRDFIGRALFTKTGSGSLAPTVGTFYAPGGLVDSTRVYASADPIGGELDGLATPLGSVQTTKAFYDRLGFVDSIINPGGRKQHFLNDARGNPIWQYPGNGTFVIHTYDWQGRPTGVFQGAVDPGVSVDGQPYADPAVTDFYRGLGLTIGPTLSDTRAHVMAYNNEGQVSRMEDDVLAHGFAYGPSGQLIGDTLIFADGATVRRGYQYNRRGQRTVLTDNVTPSSVEENDGRVEYYWNPTTARLDSMVGEAEGERYGKVTFSYDTGGRLTQRTVAVTDDLTLIEAVGAPTGGFSTEAVETETLTTDFAYDNAGRLSTLTTSSSAGTWYQFRLPIYNDVDDLQQAQGVVPRQTGAPGNNTDYVQFHEYATDGTRRLVESSRDDDGVTVSLYQWEYDVFGNRLEEAPNLTTEDGECPVEAMEYGVANVLQRAVCGSLNTVKAYGNDRSGSRLFQVDSADGFYQGVQALMTYTAKNQLYFSMTPTVQVGTYDYNWHWYDAQGLRVVSNVTSGSQYIPGDDPDPAVGTRSYYVYDGSDVQMMLTQTGGTWRVQQRLLTGGIDQALAGRFTNLQGTKRSLGLISDRQGTTLAAMRADGLQETQAIYFPRSPWGRQEGASGGGGNMNTQTGYTGAGSPNQTGGFTYLRNRWYDPATGRFLTQDPIGLAGGINLYAYAADNPVAFSDPFGLCPPCPDEDERETTGQKIRRAAEAWVAEKIDDAINLFGDAKDWLKENGPRFLAEEIVGTAVASQIPVLGQVRAGRRIAAVGKAASRFLSESTHLRNARVGARHDWARFGLSADDVVGTIVRRSGWEASSGLVSGSVRMGDHVVDYRIFNRTTGEAIVNAWIRGVQ